VAAAAVVVMVAAEGMAGKSDVAGLVQGMKESVKIGLQAEAEECAEKMMG